MKTKENLAGDASHNEVCKMSQRIISKPEVAAACGFSVPTLDRLVRDGKFPRPIKISDRRVGWYDSVPGEWLRARAAMTEAA